jgi:hypothetical protein
MSVVRCDSPGCVNQIDTDLDTEAQTPDPRHSLKGYPDLFFCTKCRARHESEADEAAVHPTEEELEALGCGGLK